MGSLRADGWRWEKNVMRGLTEPVFIAVWPHLFDVVLVIVSVEMDGDEGLGVQGRGLGQTQEGGKHHENV